MKKIIDKITGKEKELEKLEAHFSGRKLKLAKLVYSAKSLDDIEEQVKELFFTRTHAWEMRNEIAQILGREMPCLNC